MKNTNKRLALILMMMIFAVCTMFTGCSNGTIGGEPEPEVAPPVLYRNGEVLADAYDLTYREASNANFGSADSLGVTAKDYKGNALKVEAEVGELFVGEYGEYSVTYRTVDEKAQTTEKTVTYTVSGTNPELTATQADIGLETVKLEVALTADQFDTVKVMYSKKGDEENAVYMNTVNISADENGIELKTSAFTSLLEDGNREVYLKVYTADWYSDTEVTFVDESMPRYELPALGNTYIVANKLVFPFAERLTLQAYDFDAEISSDAGEYTATIAEDESTVTIKPASAKRLAVGNYTLKILAKKNGVTVKEDSLTFAVTDTFAKLDNAEDVELFKVSNPNLAEISYDETKQALKLSKKAGKNLTGRDDAALQMDIDGSMYKAFSNYVGNNRFIAFDLFMDGQTTTTMNSLLIYTAGGENANGCYGSWYLGEIIFVKQGDVPSEETRCYGDMLTCGSWYTVYVRAPYVESNGTLIIEDLGLSGFKTLWVKNFRAVDQTETGLAVFPAGYKEDEGDEPDTPVTVTPYPGDTTATDDNTFAMFTSDASLGGFKVADSSRAQLTYDDTVKAMKLSAKNGVYISSQEQSMIQLDKTSELYKALTAHAGPNKFIAFDFYMEGEMTSAFNNFLLYTAGTDSVGWYGTWFDGEVMVVAQGDTTLTRVPGTTLKCGTWYTMYVRCYNISSNGDLLMSQIGTEGFKSIYFQNFRAVDQANTGLAAYRTDEIKDPDAPDTPIVNTPYPGTLTVDDNTFAMITSDASLAGFKVADSTNAQLTYDDTVKAMKLSAKEGKTITTQDQTLILLDTTSALYTALTAHAGANKFLAFDVYAEGETGAAANGLVMYTAGTDSAGLYGTWFTGELIIVKHGATPSEATRQSALTCGEWYTIYVRCYHIETNGNFLMSQVGDAGFKNLYFQNFRAVEQADTGLGAYRTNELEPVTPDPEEPVTPAVTPYPGATTTDDNTFAMFTSDALLSSFKAADSANAQLTYDDTVKAMKLSAKEGKTITTQEQSMIQLDKTSELYTALTAYAGANKFMAFDVYAEGETGAAANGLVMYTAGTDSAGLYGTWFTGELIIVKHGATPSEATRQSALTCGEWYTIYVRCYHIETNGNFLVSQVGDAGFKNLYFQNFRAVDQANTGLAAYRTDEIKDPDAPDTPIVNTPYPGSTICMTTTLAMFTSEESISGFTVADSTRAELTYDETVKAMKLSAKEGASITDRGQAALKLDTSSAMYTTFTSNAGSNKFIAFDMYLEGGASSMANTFLVYTAPSDGLYGTWYTGELIIVKHGATPSEATRQSALTCGEWYTIYVRAAAVHSDGTLIIEDIANGFKNVYFQNFRSVEQADTGLVAY